VDPLGEIVEGACRPTSGESSRGVEEKEDALLPFFLLLSFSPCFSSISRATDEDRAR
jgi:hypothetical protein